MDEAVYCCSLCGDELEEESCCWFNEESYCDDCLEDETFVCTHCNERYSNESNAGDDDTLLCIRCYEYHYTRCEGCDCILSNEEAYYSEHDDCREYPYCYSCYDQYEKTAYLRSYSYKPTPIFHGIGSRYFGVELEIDHGGKDEHNAKILCNIANRYDDNIYIKTDGSLENGMEIVTHPMTLAYHMEEMPWKSLLDHALNLEYTSHKTETCGLHIHVNRKSFSINQYRQDECIGRVLYIIERFWEELLKFSRRTESQLKRWAARYGYKNRPEDILDTAKTGYKNRYTCVNITNDDTIEFRLFKGTLKYNTIIATLQLVNEICEVASFMTDNELTRLGWPDFIGRIDQCKSQELITYLKERQLYINEPILTTIEEV